MLSPYESLDPILLAVAGKHLGKSATEYDLQAQKPDED
jgi:hypothetical protein